jgi:hypothetical protein
MMLRRSDVMARILVVVVDDRERERIARERRGAVEAGILAHPMAT